MLQWCLKRLTVLKCMLILFAVLGTTVQAQVRVTGTVIDGETQLPLPGVNIVVQSNSLKGTSTNVDGEFSLDLDEGEEVLVFSFLGFQTLELNIESISDYSNARIVMQPVVGSLDELVVIGYGTQKENEITSSIVTVRSDDIVKTPTAQAMQA